MRHHTFVTFLGRGRLINDPETIGYQKTTYQFPNGHQEETSFFGVALAKQIKPNRVVILGTEGSQWSVLVEEGLAHTDENQAARDKLFESEIAAKVTQDMLSDIAKLMAESFKCEVVPLIIPFGRDESEQYEILDYIADKNNIPDGEVSLDLTHGFRHFGMLGFLSAFMLGRVRNLTVRDLWYGAFDMSQGGITPVFTLDGLDRVRHWINALEKFSVTGNYGVFSTLLIKDRVSRKSAEHLEKAAFHERSSNLSDAAKEINQFLSTSGLNRSRLPGASGLFQNRLLECLEWINLNSLSKQQAELAHQYLKRRDYVRAVIFGWEALVTKECEKNNQNPDNPEMRGQQNVFRGNNHSIFCRFLNEIRNALTHGTVPRSREVKEMLKDEQKLYEGLQKAFKDLFPDL